MKFPFLSLLVLPFASALVGCASPTEDDVVAAQEELPLEVAGGCDIGVAGYGANMDGHITVTADPTDTGYRVSRMSYKITSGGFFPHKYTFQVRGIIKERDASGNLKTRTIDFKQPKLTIKSGWAGSASAGSTLELETAPIDVPFGAQIGLAFTWEKAFSTPHCDATLYAFPDSFTEANCNGRTPEVGQTCAEFYQPWLKSTPELLPVLCPPKE